MDAGQYYITTLTNAAMKLGPMIFYLVAGYFLFIKLPFLLYYRTLQKPKSFNEGQGEAVDHDFQKRMEEERKKEFEDRMKNLGSKSKNNDHKSEEKKKEEPKHERTEKKAESEKQQHKERRQSEAINATPEEILFKLKPGQAFSAQELKKRYHKLLQENHPDKFRTDHQKEFAEAKTKSINEAYQKLKKRVS